MKAKMAAMWTFYPAGVGLVGQDIPREPRRTVVAIPAIVNGVFEVMDPPEANHASVRLVSKQWNRNSAARVPSIKWDLGKRTEPNPCYDPTPGEYFPVIFTVKSQRYAKIMA